MKKEIRQKLVDYEVFIANDGQEFNNENDCINYEKILRGERKVCPNCIGKGNIEVEEVYEDYHTGLLNTMYYKITCNKCNGKGYLEKTILYK